MINDSTLPQPFLLHIPTHLGVTLATFLVAGPGQVMSVPHPTPQFLLPCSSLCAQPGPSLRSVAWSSMCPRRHHLPLYAPLCRAPGPPWRYSGMEYKRGKVTWVIAFQSDALDCRGGPVHRFEKRCSGFLRGGGPAIFWSGARFFLAGEGFSNTVVCLF